MAQRHRGRRVRGGRGDPPGRCLASLTDGRERHRLTATPARRSVRLELARALVEAERRRIETAAAGAPVLSLSQFVPAAWPIIEPTSPYVHGWHIDCIAEHLDAVRLGQIENLVVNIPPRFMKSLLVSVFFPAHTWTLDPGARFIYTSYDQALSIRDSVKTRRIVESDWYQERWGSLVEITTDQNEKKRFDNTKGGFRLATSVGGGVLGEGGDFVIADDPHNSRETWSESARDQVIVYWKDTVSTRGGRWPLPRKIVVMQRLHEQDLSGYCVTAGGYVHLRLPMHRERVPWVQVGTDILPDPVEGDRREEPGALLWPERFGPKEIATLGREMTAYAKAGQLEQRPSPQEGGLFKRYHWGFWEPPDRHFGPVRFEMPDGQHIEVYPRKLPFEVDFYAQSWDFTFKGSKRAPGQRAKQGQRDRDFVSGQVWAKQAVDAFLMDRVSGRWDFPDTLRGVRDLSREWPEAGRKWYEDAANGPAVAAYLRTEIRGLIAVQPDGDLIARANAVTYLTEAGHVFLPHPSLAPWVLEVIDQAAAFPNAANDDDVSALVQALRKLFPVAPRRDADRPWPITTR